MKLFRQLRLWLTDRRELIASHNALYRKVKVLQTALEQQELINRTLTEQIGAMKTAAEFSQALDKLRVHNMRADQ